MDLADRLRIPNKYTGYIFLLDRDNRIRWRASGQMLEEKGKFKHIYLPRTSRHKTYMISSL